MLLHVSVVHSFLLLSSIQQNGNILFIHSLADGPLEFSHVLFGYYDTYSSEYLQTRLCGHVFIYFG